MHVFIIFSPIETLGSPCSCLCGLDIMIIKLFDAYRRINSWILVVTLEYLGEIRVLLICVLRCYFSTNSDRSIRKNSLRYFSTNSRIDRTERIALRWFRTLQTIYIFCSPLIGT